MSLVQLIDDYCEVWNEADPDRRAALLGGVWSGRATYTDPTVDSLDASALLEHIGRMQAARPGATVLRSTAPDEHHGVARFGFKVVAADGRVLREGVDVVFLSEDRERIDRIVGFFGPLGPGGRGPSG